MALASVLDLVGPHAEYSRIMTMLRIRSAAPPMDRVDVAFSATQVLALAETCGLWQPPAVIDRLDGAVVDEVLQSVADAGVPVGTLLRGVATAGGDDELRTGLERVELALRASPVPEHELPRLRDALGVELLQELLGVAPATLRRYLRSEREVPDDVAERAHHVALVVNDLAGSYNDRGLRRWFERPHAQLGDQAPKALLAKSWSADDEGAQQVAALAAALPELGAT